MAGGSGIAASDIDVSLIDTGDKPTVGLGVFRVAGDLCGSHSRIRETCDVCE